MVVQCLYFLEVYLFKVYYFTSCTRKGDGALCGPVGVHCIPVCPDTIVVCSYLRKRGIGHQIPEGDQALFWPVNSTEVCPTTKVALHWPDNSSIEVGYSIQEE